MKKDFGDVRITDRRRSYFWIVVSFVALVLFFVAIFFLEGDSALDNSFPDQAASRNFSASLTLSGLTYDRQTKSGVARAELKVKANNPELDVNRVAFNYEEDSSDHSRYFQYCHVGDSCLTTFEESGPDGKPLSTAAIQFDPIRFHAVKSVPEVLYPFDKPTFHLSFAGCVNDSADVCAPGDQLLFRTVRIELADADFVVDNDGRPPSGENYVFSLKRKLFIRGVSLLFLGISLVFLGYLVRLTKPDELMTKSLGFFGTLWGLRALLVPSTVKVFPTSVDYAILAAFCFLFVLTVIGVRTAPKDAGG